MRRTRGYTRRLLLLSLLFVGLAIAFTWPLALHMRTHVIGPFHADNLEYVWKIWWVKHALLDLGRSPLVHPDIYYPFGYQLAYGEITPMHTYLGVPLTVLLGPVATYNVFIVAATALTGLCTCLFVWRLLGSVPAGVTAGIIFALCPYRMARNAGPLPMVGTYWMPLLFLFTDRFLHSRKLGDALLAGASFAATALSSWYYGMMMAMLLPMYILLRAWPSLRRHSIGHWIRGGLGFGAVSALLVVPFLLPYWKLFRVGSTTVPLEQAAFWSASVTDYLTPNPRHFLWGDWVQRHLVFLPYELPWEFIVGWGIIPTILAVWGWCRGRGSVGRGWGWWIVVAWVLSLGPVVKLFGFAVHLPSQGSSLRAVSGVLNWLGRHSLTHETYLLSDAKRLALPLPALFVRWYVPGMAGMRAWGRFAVLATFGIAVIAGAGMNELLSERKTQGSRSALWYTASVAALVLFAFFTGPQQLVAVESRPVDEWLAARAERVNIIQMPLQVALSGPQMLYTMYHGQRIASGYGTYLPILFEERHPQLRTFPSDEALDALRDWGGEGVSLVLIDERDVPVGDPLWEAVASQERLQEVAIVDTVWVFEVQ